ncbi:RNA-guided endonuclease InsQ/TnpB family protein [Intestinibacter bartlettii]|uniref:Transposase n=1 Tax=Intestinibacter bartlettii TaxID=261299 RepID=A0ABS6DXC0_9FIRM|nr:RNA-guided endonuclease TnpB family protein [Intestinibacter bartlettii]MBU5335882.1 transposase [Intestinibacter bartlettii]
MITVRKIKVRCEDKTFYDFMRKEQREQNKALNLSIGYIHTNSILKSVDSGAETLILNSIEKLNKKVDKLKKDLEKPKITDKKREQTEKAIQTNLKLIKDEQIKLEEGKQFRQGLDKQFSEIYINNNNLYHVLKSQTQVQYMRTLDLVTQKVKQDYSNNFVDIVTGKCSLMNYKSDFPLMIDKKCINIFKEEQNYKIRIMLGYELDIILGRRNNENVNELKSTLEKCISGEYKICQSSISINKNDVIFNLTLDIPNTTNYEPVHGRVLGVDVGVKYPVYMCVSDNTYKRKHIGSAADFLKVRQQFQERKRKLQASLDITKGGKGRKKKTQALERFKDKERNFAKTYNHQVSKKVVEFAKKNKCETIALEKITKEGIGDTILRNWSYYELQHMIEYKAKRECIKVEFVDPAYTSQTCSKCGHVSKDNRQTQEHFKCVNCGYELNADHNAAINIARRSIDYKPKEIIEKTIEKTIQPITTDLVEETGEFKQLTFI